MPSLLFQSCGGLWTLSRDFAPHSEWTIKVALIAAHLDAEVILMVTVWR